MDGFLMRRDSEMGVIQNNYLSSEMSAFKQSERLPCMSSFVFLKRQRLHLKSSKPEEDNNIVCEGERSNEETVSGYSPPWSRQGDQHSSMYEDNATGYHHSPPLDNDSSRDERTNLNGPEMISFHETMVPGDCNRSFYANEHCGKVIDKNHTDSWNLQHNQTGHYEPVFPDMSTISSHNEVLLSSSASLSGYMAYEVDIENSFPSELEVANEPSNDATIGDKYRRASHDCNERADTYFQTNCNPPENGVQGRAVGMDIDVSHFPSSTVPTLSGMNYASVPNPVHSDFSSSLQWSRVGHLQGGALEDNSDVTGLTSSNCATDIVAPSVEKNVSEDIRFDDDIAGEILKVKGKKTDLSYIALISKAILSSPDKRMLLSDIYDYLSRNYKDIKSDQRAWRNSVRHNLSLNECFIKQERPGRGRGHYWSIHPACFDDFIKGDFRRRQARRRAKKSFLSTVDPLGTAMDSSVMDCSPGPCQVDIVASFPQAQAFRKNQGMAMGNDMAFQEMI